MLPKFVFILFLVASPATAVISLGKYNIQSGTTTTSGISSGAIMATQLHVILSSRVVGAGIFAGVPYGCALGTVSGSLTCMQTPNLVNMLLLYSWTNTYDLYNSIDSTNNLKNDKVYIYHGSVDSVVKPASGDNVQQFYQHYGATIFKQNLNSQHCQPTDNFGGPCDQLNTDNYINNCNYKGAYEMLNYLYGGMIKPQGNEGLLANLFEFDQKEFFEISNPSLSSMDDIGYVYIPTKCASGTSCKLHIAFHGCQQGRQLIGNTYVVNSGYLEVAELNNIIILFPQVVTSIIPSNPQGCWDWWGYNNNLYDTRSGNQIVAVTRMMDRMSA